MEFEHSTIMDFPLASAIGNLQLFKLLKKAGCIRLDIGVETGSQRMSKLIKKDITTEQIKSAFSMIKKNHIAAGAFFMAGFPLETEEDLNRTFTLMKEIRPDDIAFNIFDPMPGSEEYNTCITMKLVSENADWNNFAFWPDAHFVKNISPEKFTLMVNEMASWIFHYNNNIFTQKAWRLLKRRLHVKPLEKI